MTGIEDTDDGITSLSVFDPGTSSYLVQVKVYNHTGANATLIAWLDYNGNGVFDASEAITPITVNSSVSLQSFWLWWSGITSPLANGTYTYLRIRLTSASNGMTASNPTGYYNNGEVEDYKVLVDNFPLSTQLLSFDASITNNNAVLLNWSASEDINTQPYEVQRSADGFTWEHIAFVAQKGQSGTYEYSHIDFKPLKGTSYYRLALATGKYSGVRAVNFRDFQTVFSLMPNPATDAARLTFTSDINTTVQVDVLNTSGNILNRKTYQVFRGANTLNLAVDQLPSGLYLLRITSAGGGVTNKKLLIEK